MNTEIKMISTDNINKMKKLARIVISMKSRLTSISNYENFNLVKEEILKHIYNFENYFKSVLDSIIFIFFLYMLKITGIITHQRKVVIISIWLPYIINAFILVTNIGNLEYRHGNYSNYSMGVSVYTCFAMIAIYEFFSIVILLS